MGFRKTAWKIVSIKSGNRKFGIADPKPGELNGFLLIIFADIVRLVQWNRGLKAAWQTVSIMSCNHKLSVADPKPGVLIPRAVSCAIFYESSLFSGTKWRTEDHLKRRGHYKV